MLLFKPLSLLYFVKAITNLYKSKICILNINNLKYADETILMPESNEERKCLLMKVKEVRGKVGLNRNIQKTKIMASGPITSWQIDRGTMETVRDFIFLGSKITVDSDCGHEIKRHLFLGRKAMTNLDSILKSRDKGQEATVYFADKGLSSQSYGFFQESCMDVRVGL